MFPTASYSLNFTILQSTSHINQVFRSSRKKSPMYGLSINLKICSQKAIRRNVIMPKAEIKSVKNKPRLPKKPKVKAASFVAQQQPRSVYKEEE